MEACGREAEGWSGGERRRPSPPRQGSQLRLCGADAALHGPSRTSRRWRCPRRKSRRCRCPRRTSRRRTIRLGRRTRRNPRSRRRSRRRRPLRRSRRGTGRWRAARGRWRAARGRWRAASGRWRAAGGVVGRLGGRSGEECSGALLVIVRDVRFVVTVHCGSVRTGRRAATRRLGCARAGALTGVLQPAKSTRRIERAVLRVGLVA